MRPRATKIPAKLPLPKSLISSLQSSTKKKKCYIPQSPLETHFISLIHSSNSTLQLKQIHAKIILHNLSNNSRITTQLISSSSLHKSTEYALLILRNFQSPNVYLFNALIRGFSDNTHFKKSIFYFNLMLRLSVKPNWLTLPFVLKSVGALGFCRLGMGLHSGAVKWGLEFDSFVRVSLVDMYVKVGFLEFAQKVFDESCESVKLGTVLLWNVLIGGWCKAGNLRKALELLEAMPERSTVSWNCLIDGFMRNGKVDTAVQFFDRIPGKNVASWTTMISGFSQNGYDEKALSMFFRMLEDGVRPNDLSIVSALSACAKFGAFEAGKWIHDFIWKNGFQVNRAIGNALVAMYSKCGDIESANWVFSQMEEKDLLSWSVMIWGWAIHGHFDLAIQYFEQMELTGIEPDGVVFLSVLTACSHSGQVDRGLELFDLMRLDYSIEPTMKHYSLVVDLFGRSGQLDKALSFIQSMPIEPDLVIWGTLFSACRAHKNIEMAELASVKILELEPKHPGSFVFLSNVYAAVGRWQDVERIRVYMKHKGVKKDTGWSYIEAEGRVHSFVAGDHYH
ncbi:E motif, partial [Dillenia turbinata]